MTVFALSFFSPLPSRIATLICEWKRCCTILLFGVLTILPCAGQTFTTLVYFNGKNGSGPEYGALVQGVDGNFYGTTSDGGANREGTVFKMSAGGLITRLYSFCSQANCMDGSIPFTGLTLGKDANFYGVTGGGGVNGQGTVFKITPAGVLTTLHSFNSSDGAQPMGTLLLVANGNFYGVTHIGGSNNAGTIFQMTPAGTLRTIYNFCALAGCADGTFPIAGMIQGPDGNFYGTTSGSDELGGTAFKFTPQGALTTLHTFCPILNPCNDGGYLTGDLALGPDGNFYGTTYYGAPDTFGSIFKISASGTFTTLHSFMLTDGESPVAGLTLGTDGKLYGTTSQGGGGFSGTIFNITPAGSFTSLYSLNCESLNCPDGSLPYGGLLQSTAGTFYGTTFEGNGTIFRLEMGLGPFIEALPTSGNVGTGVRILGNSLTGTSSVTFNGVSTTFTVMSPTEITATVPAGATSGRIRAVTPEGILKSNTIFRVQ
jgi:uncharacterized repeat protein (TIGR03803 family)